MENEQRNRQTVQELNALIETNFDAAATVRRAMEALVDSGLRQDAAELLRDHEDAADLLIRRVRALDGTPAAGERGSNVLRESWQELWKGGGDAEVLLALRANERVAIDGLQLQLTKENLWQTMTDEGLREHMKALEMELRHFQMISDRLRDLGVQVDNDEVMGAVRNAAEHLYATVNLGGQAVESLVAWITGGRK